MAPKKGTSKNTKAAATASKKPAPKVENPLFPKRVKNFRIGGDIRAKKDLSRFVKWPKYVRVQRQRKILFQRLSIPPAVNQFNSTVEKNQAVELFKLLTKYTPETKEKKADRLAAAAEKGGETGAPPNVLKFGLKHVTALIEEKKAKLVVIASDVNPLELVVWMPALCRKMDVPYCIVKSCARVGALVGQKTATCVAVTNVNKEDENTLRTLCDNFEESFSNNKLKWTREGKPVMGLKTQMRLKKRQEAIEAELAKRNKSSR
jgi:large subunit ribosomal protein L7Ae